MMATVGKATRRVSLPAAVVLVSWFDWTPPGFGLPGRGGPYWAGALLIAGLLVEISRGTFRPFHTLAVDRELRGPTVAAGGVVAAWFLAGVSSHDHHAAFVEVSRVLVVFMFLTTTAMVAGQDPDLPQRLAWVAVVLVGVQAVLLIAGLGSNRVGALVFERPLGPHLHTGLLPRFRSFMAHPMACGSATLLLAGFLPALPRRRLRVSAIAVTLSIVAATLSFATLAIPFVLVSALSLKKRTRLVAATFVAALAVAVLWVNPLSIQIGGHILFDRAPLAGYARDGLGPRYMPIHVLAAFPVRIQFHFTAYALLASRSVSCLLEHPFGVGARNFPDLCPVWAMNTVGEWASSRSPHDVYGALLAEGGLPATVATCVLIFTLIRRFRPRPGTRFAWAVVLGYLLAGFGGANFYQFTFAALLATAAERASAPARAAPVDREPR
jgi:hypothetical protein